MANIFGTNLDDTLTGTDSNDRIYGKAGKDFIDGNKGNDLLYGGAGDDRLLARDGRDILYGDEGNDYVDGGAGNDKLCGGAGDDSLFGDNDDDILYGNSGNDSLNGYYGNDRLYGGDGNDYLTGSFGNDFVNGEAGDDTVNGARGFSGSIGSGASLGLGEIDTLTGGAGKDRFELAGNSAGRDPRGPYYLGSNDYALITDFNLNEDVITLSRNYIQPLSSSLSSEVTYSLGAAPDGLPQGTGIYAQLVNNPSASPNLIGILQGVSPESLNLNASYFQYIQYSS
ncbi:calcium-binding protein [Chroococcidiopsis sp. CCNUC1]|uniref:calcium-binding protein n=1 Tax=Chroococcidiopsis sp. CCNUC1 TaxID=2653189 RepID=UPI0020209C64|nr:calcium-binding protein [Chroococcidiopsis sp. CCNUC1]URD50264.1 hemolysin-type calcium-binding protein [Chroococcidiopsis sp. CCNUC1]